MAIKRWLINYLRKNLFSVLFFGFYSALITWVNLVSKRELLEKLIITERYEIVLPASLYNYGSNWDVLFALTWGLLCAWVIIFFRQRWKVNPRSELDIAMFCTILFGLTAGLQLCVSMHIFFFLGVFMSLYLALIGFIFLHLTEGVCLNIERKEGIFLLSVYFLANGLVFGLNYGIGLGLIMSLFLALGFVVVLGLLYLLIPVVTITIITILLPFKLMWKAYRWFHPSQYLC